MSALPISPATSDPILQLNDVHVDYGKTRALRGITHAVTQGQWLGVIGANGAGKSTFLKTVAGLVNFTGSVRVNDQEITHLSHRDFASLVAYVPQSPQFPAEMRAIDYVTMGRLPHLGYFAKENATDRLIAADLLERLGLGLMSLRTLETMSGGERQRLVLARALAQEAPVLLLDEPTSALDLGRRVEALELVDELRVEHDLTVISALHDLSLAAQFCEQLIMLANGVIVASGNAGDVLKADSLNQHFGTQVRVIRTEDGELVVVPRRTRPRGNNA